MFTCIQLVIKKKEKICIIHKVKITATLIVHSEIDTLQAVRIAANKSL